MEAYVVEEGGRADYLARVNKLVESGINRAVAQEQYQKQVFSMHIRKNILHYTGHTGLLVDTAA